MFSLGDKSEEYAGQGNWISCVSKKVRKWHATCSLALSCWKRVFDRHQRQNTTIWCKMLEMYRSAFKLSLIQTREVCIMYPISTQTITPGADLAPGRSPMPISMQAGNDHLPQSLQIHVQASDYCTQNQDLSEKMTFCHSCIQFCCSESPFLSMGHCQGKPR